jgi:hypothetical protein
MPRGALAQAERLERGMREALELVRHDPPRYAAGLELLEHFGHAVEELRFAAQIRRIQIEKFFTQCRVVGVLRRETEALAQHAPGALRYERPQPAERHLRSTACTSLEIQRVRQIGGGVDQRAVEVEQDRCEVLARLRGAHPRRAASM